MADCPRWSAGRKTSPYLYHAIVARYLNGDSAGLDKYSEKALTRVWKAQRFAWWMTLHTVPESVLVGKGAGVAGGELCG